MVLLDDLIGIQYKVHGRGDGGYDCWGLVMEVLKRVGINLPDFLYDSDDPKTQKAVYSLAVSGIQHEKTDRPKMWCVVMLKVYGEPVHSAVYIGHGRIIHCSKRGVAIENLKLWENRIEGYYEIKENND